jgi:hypothetical protein
MPTNLITRIYTLLSLNVGGKDETPDTMGIPEVIKLILYYLLK